MMLFKVAINYEKCPKSRSKTPLFRNGLATGAFVLSNRKSEAIDVSRYQKNLKERNNHSFKQIEQMVR